MTGIILPQSCQTLFFPSFPCLVQNAGFHTSGASQDSTFLALLTFRDHFGFLFASCFSSYSNLPWSSHLFWTSKLQGRGILLFVLERDLHLRLALPGCGALTQGGLRSHGSLLLFLQRSSVCAFVLWGKRGIAATPAVLQLPHAS